MDVEVIKAIGALLGGLGIIIAPAITEIVKAKLTHKKPKRKAKRKKKVA